MVDYNDNKRTVAKTYKYGIYLNPKDTLTRTELGEKGVVGIVDVNTKEGYISTTDCANLFRALYVCTSNDNKKLHYCTKVDLVSIATNVINYALGDMCDKDENKGAFINITHKFDQLQELDKLAYQVNKLADYNSDINTAKILDPINDQMCELITAVLYYPDIACKVFTKLVKLDIINNYEESWTYDTWDLSESTQC